MLGLAFVMVPGCKKGEGSTCYEADECADGLGCLGDALRRCEVCTADVACTDDGRCSARDGHCVAGSDADCKQGYVCTGKGGCTAKEGKCVVGGDADCKQSEACAKQGYCKASGNNCVKDKPAKAG